MSDQKSLMKTGKSVKGSYKALPPIPEKRYFTIGEVSHLCHTKPHVLRYWEQEFRQLKPNKRRGNRRYYSYEDVLLVRRIRELLYDKGFTIQGARLQLRGGRKSPVMTRNDVIRELEAILTK